MNSIQKKILNLLVFGGPGVGKSNLCNHLVGCKHFKSESSCVDGVTREISLYQSPALGIEGNQIINVADLPGLCDLSLPFESILGDIENKLGNLEFDTIMIVLKQSDYRASIQEVMAIKIISELMQEVQAKNIYLILTHCDQNEPSEQFIQQKIESLMKWGGIQILKENVIKFYNKKESLEGLIKQIVPGQAKFKKDLNQKFNKILEQLPGDFKKQDSEEGSKNHQEFQMLQEILEEQSQQIKELQKSSQQQEVNKVDENQNNQKSNQNFQKKNKTKKICNLI